jgi:hypothetical protein
MTEVRRSDAMRRRTPFRGNGAESPAHGRNGRGDRDLVSRRSPRRRFELEQDSAGLRLRRGRRVCGWFSGTPDPSRNGD